MVYIENILTGKGQWIQLLVGQDKDESLKYSFCHCPNATLQQLGNRYVKILYRKLIHGSQKLPVAYYNFVHLMSDIHWVLILNHLLHTFKGHFKISKIHKTVIFLNEMKFRFETRICNNKRVL